MLCKEGKNKNHNLGNKKNQLYLKILFILSRTNRKE